MISNIRLQNFRSYSDSSFEFEDGVNIIVGPNASGKTNLLEAIYFMCKGKSFRGKDSDVVLFDKPWSRVDSFVNGENRVLKIINDDRLIQKSFVIDDKIIKRNIRQSSCW